QRPGRVGAFAIPGLSRGWIRATITPSRTPAQRDQPQVSAPIKAGATHLRAKLGMALSTPGLLAGIVFFAFSLTPSLVPRPSVVQGIVSGLSFSIGYALGVAAQWLWSYLEIPAPPARTLRWIS